MEEQYTYDDQGNAFWVHPVTRARVPVEPDKGIEVHQRQRDTQSHADFFRSKKPRKETDVKNALKRSEAIQKTFQQLVYDRADVNYHPCVKQVTDKQYIEDLRLNPKFVPLPSYVHKLTTKSGTVVRPVLKGEVGMINATIYVLEPGEGRIGTGFEAGETHADELETNTGAVGRGGTGQGGGEDTEST